jgi:uncharacterized membrane protein required for colicin V production
MNWLDIIIIIILILAFIGGLKEGAVRSFFSLATLVITIPCAGLSYHLIARILSFLPGTNWEGFIAFFITMGIISVILHFIFLLPRKLIEKIWGKGCLFRLLGGVINVLGAALGLAVFALVLQAYPIFGWLERAVSGSAILTGLVTIFSFVQIMLPDVFRNASQTVKACFGQ